MALYTNAQARSSSGISLPFAPLEKFRFLNARLACSRTQAFGRVSKNFNRISDSRFERMAALSVSCSSSKIALPDKIPRKKLAVLVSGGGSNFKALHKATLRNDIHGSIELVVTDKPGCKASEYAQENEIPIVSFPKNKSAPDAISSTNLINRLRLLETDYLLLAGYLKMLPAEVIEAFPRSILNIHPSLLPAFGGKGYYGIKVHAAVIASGARYSGATIHFVDENYDTGKILAQRVVQVLADDTPEDLASRVLQQEHKLYVEVVAALCEGRIHWREDGVPLIRKQWDSEEYC